VIDGNLDQYDPDAVRVLDPHLGQSPGLGHGLPQDPHTGRGQPFMLGVDVPHLKPDHHRPLGGPRAATRYLQQSLAEKEHRGGIIRRAELPEDRQTQDIPLKATAPAQVRWPQQNAAAKHLHVPILTASVVVSRNAAPFGLVVILKAIVTQLYARP
jgi:hypothetical protein